MPGVDSQKVSDSGEIPCFLGTVPEIGQRPVGDAVVRRPIQSKARDERVSVELVGIPEVYLAVQPWKHGFCHSIESSFGEVMPRHILGP